MDLPFFNCFYIFAHRGHGYLCVLLAIPCPAGALDTYLPFNSFFFSSYFSSSKLAHLGCGYLLLFFFFLLLSPSGPWIPAFCQKTPYFSVHRDLGYLRLVFFPCPTGPRIPALILFFLFLLPIGAVDTCFNFFFLTAHRGIWWMEIMVL